VIPRVGVSACLLGRAVRYDGSHRRSAFLVEELAGQVELVPTCPEVDVGMGTPREPIALTAVDGEVRVRGAASGRDWTAALREHAVRRVAELQRLGLDGYVLKSRSPSCGLSVAVAGSRAPGRGIFAAELRARLPDLPVIEEAALDDPDLREQFVQRVLAHARAAGIRSPFPPPTPE
jgi:uncharacterized protein YbbK (DUF523 family)